jgi:hypothetical protein
VYQIKWLVVCRRSCLCINSVAECYYAAYDYRQTVIQNLWLINCTEQRPSLEECFSLGQAIFPTVVGVQYSLSCPQELPPVPVQSEIKTARVSPCCFFRLILMSLYRLRAYFFRMVSFLQFHPHSSILLCMPPVLPFLFSLIRAYQ